MSLRHAGETEPRESTRATRRYVILVVEDDDALRDVVTEQLTEDGYHVIAVRDGGQALSWLDQVAPDLILLDLMLPEISGWEVLARIGSHPMLARVPVVVMSAYADQAPLDVSHILRKPMGVDELRRTVRRFCA
jgi:CheY-like chemotaxis protein